MNKNTLIIISIILFIACTVLNIMYVLDKARQDSRQELFQKVIVMKSRPMKESLRQDSIKSYNAD